MKRSSTRMVSLILTATMLFTTGCGFFKNGAGSLPLPGGPELGGNPYTVRINFGSVQKLVPHSLVKFNNVVIGEVQRLNVDPQTWTAVAVCELRGEVKLPANARAYVRSSGLLGQTFVSLATPEKQREHGQLTEGAEVPISRTETSPPVEEILGALSMLLNGGGLPQLHSIIGELNAAMGGNEPQLRALLHELTTLVGSLNRSSDDITRALESLNGLSRTLDERRGQLATVLEDLPEGVGVLAEQHDELVVMLDELDRLSRVTVDVVRASKKDLVADLEALQPILKKLAEAGADLPKAVGLVATFPFTPGMAQGIFSDYINVYAGVDLNLGHLLGNLSRSNQPVNVGGIQAPNLLRMFGQDETRRAAPRRESDTGSSTQSPTHDGKDAGPDTHEPVGPSGLPGVLDSLLGGHP